MTTCPAAYFHPGNLLTYLSLSAAVAAVAAAVRGSLAAAGACMAIAVIADTFDGRYARLFSRSEDERSFGAHLDSLSDAAAFGLAPVCCTAALLPAPSFPGMEAVWWIAAGAYAIAAITRLAFYHLPGTDATTFTGVPAPVAALLWTSALLLRPGWLLSSAIVAGIAIAMVAPLPIRRPAGVGLAAFVAWPLVVGAAHLAALIW